MTLANHVLLLLTMRCGVGLHVSTPQLQAVPFRMARSIGLKAVH